VAFYREETEKIRASSRSSSAHGGSPPNPLSLSEARYRQSSFGSSVLSIDGLRDKPAYWYRESKFVPREEYGLGPRSKRAKIDSPSPPNTTSQPGLFSSPLARPPAFGSASLARPPPTFASASPLAQPHAFASAATFGQSPAFPSTSSFVKLPASTNGFGVATRQPAAESDDLEMRETKDLHTQVDGDFDEENYDDYEVEEDEEISDYLDDEGDYDDEEDDEEDEDGQSRPDNLKGGSSMEDAIEL